jgi:biopolymer transport protein ExbD
MRLKFREPDAPSPLTPLIDIAFLVLIFFMALPYKRLDGKIEAHLPKEGPAPLHMETPPPETVRLRVRRALGNRPLRFELGEHAADSPAGLEPLLRKLGPKYAYEIQADAGVAWKEVVRVVDLLRALEYEDVRFYGTKRPSPAVQRTFQLPMPE